MKKLLSISTMIILFTGCAYKDPVLYPNAKYNKIGKSSANQIVSKCEDKAKDAGLKKDKSLEKAARRGGAGVVAGAATGAASTAIYGGNVGRGTAAGAVGGSIWGFFSTLFSSEDPNPVYKRYVDTCVRDNGLKVIGWD